MIESKSRPRSYHLVIEITRIPAPPFLKKAIEWKQGYTMTPWKIHWLKTIINSHRSKSDLFVHLTDIEKSLSQSSWSIEYFEEHYEEILEEIYENYGKEPAEENIEETFERASRVYIQTRNSERGLQFFLSMKPIHAVIPRVVVAFYLNKNRFEEAAEYINSLSWLESENEKHMLEKQVEREKEKKQAAEKKKREEMKSVYFMKTDKLQKRILFHLYRLLKQESKHDVEGLSMELGIEPAFLNKQLNELIHLGLLYTKGNKITELHPVLRETLADYIDSPFEGNLVKTTEEPVLKPFFIGEMDRMLYAACLDVFPDYHVFPKVSLQSFIPYEELKKRLPSDLFSYYLKTDVDFLLVEADTSLPVMALERESRTYSPEVKVKRGMKDAIFKASGIPLVRVRTANTMELEALKRALLETVS